MSVRANERDESSIEFLRTLRDIEKWCIEKTNTCPKKYRYIINTQLLSYAANAYCLAKMANSIKVTNSQTKRIREKYTTKAYATTQAFVSQIDVIYEVCKSDFLTNHELQEISKRGVDALKLLNGLIKSDKNRYQDY